MWHWYREGGEVRENYRSKVRYSKKNEKNITSHFSEFKEIQITASHSVESKEIFGAIRCGVENWEQACGTRSCWIQEQATETHWELDKIDALGVV